jgi:hypothetical protein
VEQLRERGEWGHLQMIEQRRVEIAASAEGRGAQDSVPIVDSGMERQVGSRKVPWYGVKSCVVSGTNQCQRHLKPRFVKFATTAQYKDVSMMVCGNEFSAVATEEMEPPIYRNFKSRHIT